MKIALISDIHGNFDALKAAAREIERQQVDRIYSLGDVIGYGAEPEACVSWVDSNCDGCLTGNHEMMLLNGMDHDQCTPEVCKSVEWTKNIIGDHAKSIISLWPMALTISDMILVHASPHCPEMFNYIMGFFDSQKAFEVMKEEVCFFGHTHYAAVIEENRSGNPKYHKNPFEISLEKGKRYLLNVGSIGQPRNNDPDAQWMIYDMDQRKCSFHKTFYPVKEAQKKIISAGLPLVFARRLTRGR